MQLGGKLFWAIVAFGASLVFLIGILLFFNRKGAYMVAYPIIAGLQNNVPIKFYGRVLDQDGKGVAGATVGGRYESFSITEHLQGHTYVPQPVSVTTDADGNFVLKGISGTSLLWDKCSRDGYRYAQPLTTFTYSNDVGPLFKPDPAHPVVFHMWRLGEANDKLVSFNADGISFAFSKFPKSIYFGLPVRVREGRFDDADLIVEGHSNIPGDTSPYASYPKPPFEWSFTLEVPYGGLIETDDPYLYQAPESGYIPHYKFEMKANDPHWMYDVHKRFYIKSHDGQRYAILSTNMRFGRGFDYAGTVSSNGSRNFQRAEK